jgi:hypothetical protein
MKQVLVIAGDSAFVNLSAIHYLEHFKKCYVGFFLLPEVSMHLSADDETLFEELSISKMPMFTGYAPQLNTMDYILCFQKQDLEKARQIARSALVFDYHFDFGADKKETLLAMKQYIDRFCKIYLNEFV